MSPVVHQALRILQQRALAKVLHEVGRVRNSTKTLLLSHTDKIHARIVRCEMDIARLRLAMTREQLVELKIARALYLLLRAPNSASQVSKQC